MTDINTVLARRKFLAQALAIGASGAAVALLPNQLIAAITNSNEAGNPMKKRVFITGSSTGLGQMTAALLVEQGHSVVLHGRSTARAQDALNAVPGAIAALHGDFESMEQIRDLARQANGLGSFDAIIHNAGLGDEETKRVLTVDGLPRLFSINVLAPYMLTALIQPPQRLIYISSSMQMSADGDSALDDPLWERRRWNGSSAYSESKLLLSMLAFNVAQSPRKILCNTVDPGWVPTRMGGPGASDDLYQGHLTQAWLAVSDAPSALGTGNTFYHMKKKTTNPDANDVGKQRRLIELCGHLSGTPFSL